MAPPNSSASDDEERVESEVPTKAPGGATGERQDAPRRISHFRLLELLGSGGQGEVYVAEDQKLGRRVALKILSRRFDFADGNAKSLVRARFEREAEILARLDHPGICAVYEFGYDGAIPWLSMRLVEGRPLDRSIAKSRGADRSESAATQVELRLDSKALDDAKTRKLKTPSFAATESVGPTNPARDEISAILRVIETAALALHAAHQAGLVHRDVKPGNIMVTPEGQAVLLDFGLAQDTKDEGPALTMTGDFLGTPSYMSPEQFDAGATPVDRRSDVYSLGATLFECLSLRRPFQAPTRDELRRAVHIEPTPDLRRLNGAVSRDLATVVACAMEKDPNRRYQTMQSFADDLRHVLAFEPVLARPVGSFTKTWRWGQRNPVVASLVAALALFLLVGVAWTSWKNRELARLNTSLVDANIDLETSTNEARRLAKIARDETTAKTQALAEYQKMADARRLENADREARQLWPVGPDIVDDLMAWQTRYAPLFARLPAHEQALVELESQALPYTAEDRTRDFAEELDLIQQIKDSLAPLRPEFRREYEARMKRLTKVVDGRRSWDFGEDVDRQFRHGALRRLTSAYRKFEVPDTGVRASIAKRLEQSRRIQDETIINQQELWDACIARIKESKKYGGMELSPQLGLVPLGANPTSGFEEFLHWQTHDGPLPQRNAKGRWSLSEKTGVVFALLPRGTFLMGSQNERPEDKRYDKLFRDNELLHEVTLDAFFISKFEMTQGQWKRFTGEVPSSYLPGFKSRTMIHAITAAHPVENVTWFRCRKVLRQLGMLIPTEAQWEYAARAGQDSLYSGTSDPAELGRFANMPGIETKGLFGNADSRYADDYPTHAPVGSFDPNEFGLYDMNGNLWEWCRDRFGTYQNPTRPGDGLRPSAASNRQYRGGSFGGTPEQQRLAYRTETNPELKFNGLGIRPSRRIEP